MTKITNTHNIIGINKIKNLNKELTCKILQK